MENINDNNVLSASVNITCNICFFAMDIIDLLRFLCVYVPIKKYIKVAYCMCKSE